MQSFDIVVIGAGIAGASVAAHLAKSNSVALIDMEERAGYHTTSRSAAMYEPNYGPPPMLAFTRASAAFFKSPPRGFADTPLISPRQSLFFMPEGQEKQAEELLTKASALDEISEADARSIYPVLRHDYAQRTFLDRHTADLDVDVLHRGYLRLFKERGGTMVLVCPVTSMERKNGNWTINGSLTALTVINAAGAWADHVAQLAGAKPAGIVPKRRSIAVVPLPNRKDFANWPMVTDVGETWYSKPQSGKLIVSSADATPVEPHDAYADDMAIAQGIENMMTATTIEVERVEHTWGGLRSFAADGNPVVGYDPSVDGLFWLAGQGGYGIQTAPALSETAAALVLNKKMPEYVMEHGLALADIAPERLV
jgi:D-arginine dehydrogenase